MVRLLVAALEEELVAFPREIPGFLTVVTGVGKVLAAAGLSTAIAEHRPTAIIVAGTAGSVGALAPGSVLRPTATVQTDATSIDPIVGRAVSAPRSLPIDGGRDAVTIGTADSFIEEPGQVGRILAIDPGIGLVDMETYAYVAVARRHGIPITVVKAVSDLADEAAAVGWAESATACSARLWEALRDELAEPESEPASAPVPAPAASLIARLRLEPHPEGGWYRQTWASPVEVRLPDGRVRPTATLILFYLPAGASSAWHVVRSAEHWIAHTGSVAIELGGSGPAPDPRAIARHAVAPDGEPQLGIPAGVWQRTLPAPHDALVSCLVSPGFDFEDFRLAPEA